MSSPSGGDALAWRLLAVVGLLALLALAASAPAWLNLYWLRVMSNVLLFATLAQAINIIAGYTGYPAFGNVVFFGVGGYTASLLMLRLGWPFAASVLAATLVSALIAFVLSRPMMRLRGHYFALATLGLNEATRSVIANLTDLTGGGMGLSLPLPPGGVTVNAARFYYLFLGAALLALAVTWQLDRSRLGLACRAVRDDESKAEAMGVDTNRAKAVAWTLSAALTGLVGAINAYWMSYIEPPAVFDVTISVKAFVMYLLGGAGSVLGPLIGAVFVELALTFAWGNLLSYHLGVMGLVIIVVLIFMPDGFLAFLRGRRTPLAVVRAVIGRRARRRGGDGT